MILFCMSAVTPAIAQTAEGNTYILNGHDINYKPAVGPADDLKEIKKLDENRRLYVDYASGYQLAYPHHMSVDPSMQRTVLYDSQTCIEIYYDNFSQSESVSSVWSYINYSNKMIKNLPEHHIGMDYTIALNGHKVHILSWSREQLAKVNNDKNYYLSAEIIKNNQEVYTLIFKSTHPVEGYMPILESFTFINRQGSPGINCRLQPVNKKWNHETAEFYNQFFGPEADLHWGIFDPYAPESFATLKNIEKQLNYEFPVVVYYQTIDSAVNTTALQNAWDNNRVVELTLQTFSYKLNPAQNQTLTYKILRGEYDSYLHNYARSLKDFGHPVLFRLNNEMNGDWCTYSSYYYSKDTELYKALWQYVHNVFAEEQADNVLWVWNPHDNSFPDFEWNNALHYFPGEEYVDIVGLTGYNTGNYYPGEKWRSFKEIYDPLYRMNIKAFDYPLMITEFGSNSVGGDKIAWIREMFANMSNYPAIKLAVWWSGTDWDSQMRPARIYRLDENQAILKAFQEGLNKE